MAIARLSGLNATLSTYPLYPVSVCLCSPVSVSHSRSSVSSCRLPLAIVRPSGLNTTPSSPRIDRPSSTFFSVLVATSHKRMSKKPLLVIVVPARLNPTLSTSSPTSIVFLWVPVATSHRRMVSSSLPLAIMRPSGLNATLLTELVCPMRVCLSVPVATSHR